MQQINYKQLIDKLSELIDEGIQIVDKDGTTVLYSNKMAQLEKQKKTDVLGAQFYEGYPALSLKKSTLLQALQKGKTTLNKPQTYTNKFNEKISTVNSTIPIIMDGDILGALEVAKESVVLNTMGNKKASIKRYTFDDLIGEEEGFKKIVTRAKLIAGNPFPVLLFGETGTGKELFAQSIHQASPRRDRPFVAQNCSAVPENLLESILFGTVRGSFTGAEDRAGLFEQASGGTLLLDEISTLPYSLQSKLLRVLQEKYIRRVGGTKDIAVDVRVIATSNESLEALVKEGRFRNDLYYRLNTITLNLLPLRKRKGDIILLAEAFIKKHSGELNCNVKELSQSAKKVLLAHDYSGNVRELENVIISAMSLAGESTVLSHEHINFFSQEITEDFCDCRLDGITLPEKLEHIECMMIRKAMKKNGGNISRSAKELGIKRQSLQHKLKKYQENK